MHNFITVSSQSGSSKTIVNVNSLNKVSYHLSNSAQRVVEHYRKYGIMGLFNRDDFYSVLDVNGSNVNTLDSIDEIVDMLNGVSGVGHGMTYVLDSLVKANKEVTYSPKLLASYFSNLVSYLYDDKVYKGKEGINLAWTDKMVESVISLYKIYVGRLPEDFSYDFVFPITCLLIKNVEISKGKASIGTPLTIAKSSSYGFASPMTFLPPENVLISKDKESIGIPLTIAKNLRIGSESGMLIANISSFDLKIIQAKRYVSPRYISTEGKGNVVGINDYTSVMVSLPFFLNVVVDVETFIKYLLSILKKANGVDHARNFLNDLFNMFCNVEHDSLTSYLESYPAAEFTSLDDEYSKSLVDMYPTKGGYVYVPAPIIGGIPW